MNIITIGDIHGVDKWKLINPDHYDYIIFIGDYVDAFDISNVIIKANLLDIISFKKKYNDKVVLLWGNHDLQYRYLGVSKYGCSGFRPESMYDLNKIFTDNDNLFQMSFQINNYLWNHAGIHKGWYEYRFKKALDKKPTIYENCNSISEQLNKAFEVKESCLFDVGHIRGGYMDVGGPFWSDKTESYTKPLEGYHQIVGHTKVKDILTNKIDDDTSITYTDCLPVVDSFHMININKT